MSQETEEAGLQKTDGVKSDLVDASITMTILLVTVGFLWKSQSFAGMRISGNDPGAAFWPRATLGVIVLAGTLNLWMIFRRSSQKDVDVFTLANVVERVRIRLGTPSLTRQQWEYMSAIAISILYLALLKPVGFVAVTPLYLFGFSWIVGYRSPVKLTVFSIGVTVLIFIAFSNFMNIALPYGNGVFRELSVFFQELT